VIEGEYYSAQFKYRLFYGRSGKRIVGYDNERPKGDHRHRDGQEEHYEFKDVETLARDAIRGKHAGVRISCSTLSCAFS
jgi:hypothetical protein